MPEYIGSSCWRPSTRTPARRAPTRRPRATALAARLAPLDISVLGYTPAVDTNAFVVTADDRRSSTRSTTISDLAAIAGELTWGLPAECVTQPAVRRRPAQVRHRRRRRSTSPSSARAAARSSTALVSRRRPGGRAVLDPAGHRPERPRRARRTTSATQPADALAPIVRNDLLRALAAQGIDVAAILDPVSAAITTEDLTALNVRVGVDQEDLDVVAQRLPDRQGAAAGCVHRALAARQTLDSCDRGRSPRGGRPSRSGRADA